MLIPIPPDVLQILESDYNNIKDAEAAVIRYNKAYSQTLAVIMSMSGINPNDVKEAVVENGALKIIL